MGKPLTASTLDDYLAWEELQPERHEFHRGEIFARVGARRVHNELAGNLFATLRTALRGSPCKAYIETAKLQIGFDTVLCPDVFVTCDAADLGTDRIFKSPTVVIEVLSPSTQRYNSGAEFTLYRRIEALREYVRVDPDTREAQVYRRNDAGLFTVHDQTGEPAIRLESLALDLPAEDVFEGLPPAVPIDPGERGV